MQFSKTNTDFPTLVHRIIYITALRQIPTKVSLAETDGFDPTLIESCREYHAFILDMLSNMYNNPIEWGMNAGEYDAFLYGRKENAMKKKDPSKTLSLRSITYNSVPAYLRLLMYFAKAGQVNENIMLIPPEDYIKIKSEYTKSKTSKYKIHRAALERVGFIVTENNDGSAEIESKIYPNMLNAMSLLAKSAKTVKTFGDYNFFNTDFRQIRESYTPQYEDVVGFLNDEQRTAADEIHKLCKVKKLRVSCTTFWKINYHYKGKHVMCLDTDEWMGGKGGLCNNFRIRINGSKNERYLNNIASLGEEFKKYYMRHMNYCTACSTSHIGWTKEVFGRKVRLCGDPAFRILNPKLEDIIYINKFIELRMEEIRLEKEKNN